MPARIPKNVWAWIKGMVDDDMLHLSDAGAPTDGTSGTGATKSGPGSLYFDITNKHVYVNEGTKASPEWHRVGQSGIQYKELALTNAQVLALRAAPITLVAAPGAGKYLEFLGGVLLFDRTAAYTESADNLAVKYVDGSGTAASEDIEMTGFIDAAADAITVMNRKKDVLGVKTLFENQPLVLHNTGDGEFGGGNAANVLRVKVHYRVWPTGF